MATVTIRPTAKLKGEICAPPSKSYTQRMLIAASLSQGISKISGPLVSDDTEATLRAVKALGVRVNLANGCWTVEGTAEVKAAREPIDCGESGATLRFMIPVAALAAKPSVFLLGHGLQQRPIEPLLQSLKELGAETSTGKIHGKSYVKVEGGGIKGGKTSIRGDVSSQFISGLMFACTLASGDTEISVTTLLESKGYVEMTRKVLAEHGINIRVSEDLRKIHIPSGQTYKPCDHMVPGDFSSAAFLLAAAAITRSKVTVKNLDYSLVQDDKAIVGILKHMGVDGKVCSNQIVIEGTGESLKSVDVNAKDTPDLVPVCAALACYANGTSRIHGATRLRLKESDRLQSLHVELAKMGANIAVDQDSLTVKGPCKLQGAEINPHNDHRIAMACAVAAVRAESETVIHDAECVKKSYPRFFIDLHRLGADVVGGEFDR
jgi:3-phosphoshikimate 1-carboxyvinyltransferase